MIDQITMQSMYVVLLGRIAVVLPQNSIWSYLSSDLARSEREYC